MPIPFLSRESPNLAIVDWCLIASKEVSIGEYVIEITLANYVHGIGNGNSRRDIPCPVTVGSYLLTINAVLLISTL